MRTKVGRHDCLSEERGVMTESTGERETKRAATERAMLDAAERLFSDHGFEIVSVRDIARAAGVSHALVHRYLGSKDEIYRAVMRRNENLILDAAGGTEDLVEAMSLMLREGLVNHRPYLRLLVHSALHGLPYDTSIVDFTATQRLIELAEARASRAARAEEDVVEPRFAMAAIVALYLGWASMEGWLVKATGMEGLDEETLLAGLERVVLHLAATLVPGADA
jgi:AcrR family transcriptional regulator